MTPSNGILPKKSALAGRRQSALGIRGLSLNCPSSQVAHSQIDQREITFDEVMKAKVFFDFIMHKTFKAQANQIMEARRDA